MRAILLGKGPLRDAVAVDLETLGITPVGEGAGADLLVTITAPVRVDDLRRPEPGLWSDASDWVGRITAAAAAFYASAPDPDRDARGEVIARAQILHVIDQVPGLARPRHASHAIAASGLLAMTRIGALQLAPRLRVNAIVPARPSGAIRGTEDEIRPGARDVRLDPSPGRLIETLRFAITTPVLTGEILSVPGIFRD